ncbi:dipeptide ABC transporter ATP-binding protein [Nocardia alba]|uniref:Peptide/nickel transport system ATP-binding protein n=1 Tax=Nocardia alba TaxID=225051 RepID=A0A4R1FW66_9NOCA|nr:ABC transporter ATP-binding protein [Nocardia alba]TCJ95601.1 peptide/nickel transport system ATP-binding protein [Nocardia alba]
MSEKHTLLRVEDLTVRYRTRGADGRAAVDGVSLTVGRGEFVSIVGESGSGKSTTIHAALRLLPPSARVEATALELNGHDTARWKDRELARLRGPFVGFVPQDPGTSLNPVKRVGAQVLEALRLHRRVESGPGRELAVAKLATAGLRDPQRVYRQYPHELSGGMKQRVLIAIALANDPALLVADEPTSALDVTVQKVILDHLAHLRDTLGLGVLLVTHDLGVAAERSDRLIVMQHGRIVEEGPAARIVTDPRHDYTRRLVAAAPTRHSTRLTSTGTRLESGGRPSPGATPKPGSASSTGTGSSTGRVLTPPTVIGSSPERATPAPKATRALLEVRELTKTFAHGGVRAVDRVSLAVRAGTTHALVGESGAGKSTVARIAAGFTAPDSGQVWFDGARIDGLSRGKLRPIRREIQFVYQNPYSSLDPKFTVAQIIAEPLVALGLLPRGPRRHERVRELLDDVALSREHLARRPAELSGGQRQRVAVARALAAGPRVLVLDEAVSALDVSVQAQILRLLVDLQHQQGLTYLFITHDLGVVRLVADEVTVMRAGAVVESGSVTDVFEQPTQDYTRRLLDAVPAGEPDRAAVAAVVA